MLAWKSFRWHQHAFDTRSVEHRHSLVRGCAGCYEYSKAETSVLPKMTADLRKQPLCRFECHSEQHTRHFHEFVESFTADESHAVRDRHLSSPKLATSFLPHNDHCLSQNSSRRAAEVEVFSWSLKVLSIPPAYISKTQDRSPAWNVLPFPTADCCEVRRLLAKVVNHSEI